MTEIDYKEVGSPEDRMLEELSELLQAMAKARRFGIDNICPPGGGKPSEVGKTNRQLILEEIADVLEMAPIYRNSLLE